MTDIFCNSAYSGIPISAETLFLSSEDIDTCYSSQIAQFLSDVNSVVTIPEENSMPQTNPQAYLNIERVTDLPAIESRKASTMYIVQGDDADLAELYFTGNDVAEVRHVFDKSEVAAMISAAVTDFTNIQVVADNTERDALNPTRNILVLSLDATADTTVGTGSALYVYDAASTTYHKVSEFESLDVTLNWDSIVGKPTSTAAQIDDAVNKAHTHTNKVLLDGLGTDSDGRMTLDGVVVAQNPVSVAAW